MADHEPPHSDRKRRSFESELAVFEKHRAQWISGGQNHRWVVIHGSEVLGFWDSLAEGFYAGTTRYEPGDFLVKQVDDDDRPVTIRRAFWGDAGRSQAG